MHFLLQKDKKNTGLEFLIKITCTNFRECSTSIKIIVQTFSVNKNVSTKRVDESKRVVNACKRVKTSGKQVETSGKRVKTSGKRVETSGKRVKTTGKRMETIDIQ